MAPSGFPLKTSEVAALTGLRSVVVNRYRAVRIIPLSLRTQEQENGIWYYADAAVEWVELGKKVLKWNVTEAKAGEFFEQALDACGGDTTRALARLLKAFDGATNFEDFKARFQQNFAQQ